MHPKQKDSLTLCWIALLIVAFVVVGRWMLATGPGSGW
jgi:hypothetical protein